MALIQGASRGIGLHLTQVLLKDPKYRYVFATCRDPESAGLLRALEGPNTGLRVLRLDVLEEASIAASAETVLAEAGRLDLLINCAGILHTEGGLRPEKRLADVDPEFISTAFRVNALGALLVAREFESLLRAGTKPVFAALSARVGSIGDNRRGGWYAYRASKAALNMMIRTLAIEWSRLSQPISCFLLHPGTVATDLSAPFRSNLSTNQIFAPDQAARQLLQTVEGLGSEQSGGFYAYDGKKIEW